MNTANLIAALSMAALLFFTAGGMYVSCCRTAFLSRDSLTSKTVLGKFGTRDDLARFDEEGESLITTKANATLHRFSQAFVNEVAQTRKGLGHPTPNAKLADF